MSDDLFYDTSNPSPQDAHSHDRGSQLVTVNQQNQPLDAQSAMSERLDELAQELLELKLVYLSDTDTVKREVETLRGHMYWLTVALIGVITIASGSMSWLALSLRSDQAQLTRQVESIASETVPVERMNQLEAQINTLGDRLPDNITANIQTNQEQLQDLERRIAEVAGQVNTRRETIAILARALQDLINVEDQEAIAPIRNQPDTPPDQVESPQTNAAPNLSPASPAVTRP